MGIRVRLKASFQIPASFSATGQALLQAMKTYGLILADNGSNWYVSGAPDERWNNDAPATELGSVHGRGFEVLRMDGPVAGLACRKARRVGRARRATFLGGGEPRKDPSLGRRKPAASPIRLTTR